MTTKLKDKAKRSRSPIIRLKEIQEKKIKRIQESKYMNIYIKFPKIESKIT